MRTESLSVPGPSVLEENVMASPFNVSSMIWVADTSTSMSPLVLRTNTLHKGPFTAFLQWVHYLLQAWGVEFCCLFDAAFPFSVHSLPKRSDDASNIAQICGITTTLEKRGPVRGGQSNHYLLPTRVNTYSVPACPLITRVRSSRWSTSTYAFPCPPTGLLSPRPCRHRIPQHP